MRRYHLTGTPRNPLFHRSPLASPSLSARRPLPPNSLCLRKTGCSAAMRPASMKLPKWLGSGSGFNFRTSSRPRSLAFWRGLASMEQRPARMAASVRYDSERAGDNRRPQALSELLRRRRETHLTPRHWSERQCMSLTILDLTKVMLKGCEKEKSA